MKVIDNKYVTDELTIGKEYEVLEIDTEATDDPIVTVVNDLGEVCSYTIKRFGQDE